MPRFASPKRIAPPPPAHLLWRRGCATPATLCEPETDGVPTHGAFPAVSRKCHACHTARARIA
eukprot:3718073-Pyramimonas_sp.AAC.1